MAVFGITGNLTSGKSTLVKFLKRKGAVVFDADSKVHQYYRDKNSEVYRRVSLFFPQAVKKGLISREELAKIVFFDKKKLYKLERIVHPFVIRDLKEWIREVRVKDGIFAAEVPLLFEKNLNDLFDGVILVFVKKDILLKRIIEKFNFSRSEAQDRLALFKSVKEKMSLADFVIDNSKGLNEFSIAMELLLNKLNNFKKR